MPAQVIAQVAADDTAKRQQPASAKRALCALENRRFYRRASALSGARAPAPCRSGIADESELLVATMLQAVHASMPVQVPDAASWEGKFGG